jgi:hypothetical protein
MPKWSENTPVGTTFAIAKTGGSDSFDRGGVTFARRTRGRGPAAFAGGDESGDQNMPTYEYQCDHCGERFERF